jgi:hypothetical protein
MSKRPQLQEDMSDDENILEVKSKKTKASPSNEWKPKEGAKKYQTKSGANEGKWYWCIRNEHDNSLDYFEWDDPKDRAESKKIFFKKIAEKKAETKSSNKEVMDAIDDLKDTLHNMMRLIKENGRRITDLEDCVNASRRKVVTNIKTDPTVDNIGRMDVALDNIINKY